MFETICGLVLWFTSYTIVTDEKSGYIDHAFAILFFIAGASLMF